MMIGIIGAMDVEVDGLKALANEWVVRRIGRLDFYVGRLFGQGVVLVRCGVGKVNAASATSIMLSHFDIDEVVCLGIAGGVDKRIRALDIVVASAVAQHDFDATAAGYAIGEIERGFGAFYGCCEGMAELLFGIASGYATCFRGVVASGDRFVASSVESGYIANTFSAVACDMESGAIGQVCRQFDKDFAVIRTISDNANESAACDFAAFESAAAHTSIRIIADYLSLRYGQKQENRADE